MRSEGSRAAYAPGLAYARLPQWGFPQRPRMLVGNSILSENQSDRKGVVGRISRLYGAGQFKVESLLVRVTVTFIPRPFAGVLFLM
jgi:hypothetical protein